MPRKFRISAFPGTVPSAFPGTVYLFLPFYPAPLRRLSLHLGRGKKKYTVPEFLPNSCRLQIDDLDSGHAQPPHCVKNRFDGRAPLCPQACGRNFEQASGLIVVKKPGFAPNRRSQFVGTEGIGRLCSGRTLNRLHKGNERPPGDPLEWTSVRNFRCGVGKTEARHRLVLFADMLEAKIGRGHGTRGIGWQH
jgi:hypothetical protein